MSRKMFLTAGLACLCVWGSLSPLMTDEKVTEGLTPPPMEANLSNTQLWCTWAKEVLANSDFQSEPRIQLEKLRDAMAMFKSCPAEVALRNSRHFADLQVMEGLERDFLFAEGQWLISHASDIETLKNLQQQMEVAQSPAEDLLPLLKALNQPTLYLEQLEIVFKWLEKSPEKLKRPVPIPPDFFLVEHWSAEDCHRALNIFDISFKQHWRPTLEEVQKLLLPIARRYESLNLPRFALDLLLLTPPYLRNATVHQEIGRYEALWQKQKNQENAGSLY